MWRRLAQTGQWRTVSRMGRSRRFSALPCQYCGVNCGCTLARATISDLEIWCRWTLRARVSHAICPMAGGIPYDSCQPGRSCVMLATNAGKLTRLFLSCRPCSSASNIRRTSRRSPRDVSCACSVAITAKVPASVALAARMSGVALTRHTSVNRRTAPPPNCQSSVLRSFFIAAPSAVYASSYYKIINSTQQVPLPL